MRGTCMLVPSDFKSEANQIEKLVHSISLNLALNYACIVFFRPNWFTQHSFQVTLTDY
jgi:hypothetical protein